MTSAPRGSGSRSMSPPIVSTRPPSPSEPSLRSRAPGDGGKVEQRKLERRGALCGGGKKGALPSADIHEPPMSVEAIGVEDGFRDQRLGARHQLAVCAGAIGVRLRRVVDPRRPADWRHRARTGRARSRVLRATAQRDRGDRCREGHDARQRPQSPDCRSSRRRDRRARNGRSATRVKGGATPRL